MIKTIVVLLVYSFGNALGQDIFLPQDLVAQPLRLAAQPLQQAGVRAQQVVNLGDVVVNVVIAKVLGDGNDSELTIAKFGGKEVDRLPSTNTTMKAEKRTRTRVVNGETKVETFTVHVPVTTVSNTKENFTPTEQDRSVSISTVQAFDLKGNPR